MRLVVLALALLAAGCVTVVSPIAPVATPVPQSEPPTARPSVASVAPEPTPTATPSPTIRPVVTPRPVATPRPTPRPVETPVFDEAYFDFLTEALTWLGELEADIAAISDAADRGRIRQMRPVIAEALGRGEDIQTWLLINPPSPCYAVTHDQWQNFIDLYVEALDDINYGLTPPITIDDVERGVLLYQLATDAFLDIDIEAATCL